MKFRTMWTKNVKTAQDLSNRISKTFKTVKPGAVDPTTGVVLNSTYEPITLPGEDIDIQERIQSYKDECDLYKTLELVAMSGDTTRLNVAPGVYSDITDMPTNIHEVSTSFDKAMNLVRELDLEEEVATGKYSSEQLMSIALDKKLKRQAEEVAAQQAQNGGAK